MMNTRIYKEVHFDASHRLFHYKGKCHNLHGHRWKVEVWIEGSPDQVSCILVDYNTIKQTVERFDHQIILNREDPMVQAITPFQEVVTVPGDPTSELLAAELAGMIDQECRDLGLDAHVRQIRVWESPACYAELTL